MIIKLLFNKNIRRSFYLCLKPFEKWINTEKRLKIAFGGRGGGKSESIARILIAKSCLGATDIARFFSLKK